MKVTKSDVGAAVVWCIFCNWFSTDIYKDTICVDAQMLKTKENIGILPLNKLLKVIVYHCLRLF